VNQSLKEDGKPATLWFWDDWFSSFDVRACSLAARGLWVDMLGIMARAEIKGTLAINGKQLDDKTLATISGITITGIKPLLIELEDNGVFSKLSDGTIINRRMFNESERKELISQIRSRAGKKGAKTRWQTDNKNDFANGKNGTSNPSSSSNQSNKKDSRESSIAESPGDRTFEEIWEIWPRKEDKGKAKEKYNFLINEKKIDPKRLQNAAIGYLRCEKSKGTEVDFIKYLKTFFYAGNPKKNIPGTWEGYEKYADDKYKQGPPL
jgi:hypothetical protein